MELLLTLLAIVAVVGTAAYCMVCERLVPQPRADRPTAAAERARELATP